jgi:hypothetical protein
MEYRVGTNTIRGRARTGGSEKAYIDVSIIQRTTDSNHQRTNHMDKSVDLIAPPFKYRLWVVHST